MDKTIVQTCAECKSAQTITQRSSARAYRVIVITQCICGYFVEPRSKINLENFYSRHPLPGFDRESMRLILAGMGVLL